AYAGAGALVVDGPGRVILRGTSDFTGGITLNAGATLDLAVAAAAGRGAVAFAGPSLLQLAGAPAGGLAGVGPGGALALEGGGGGGGGDGGPFGGQHRRCARGRGQFHRSRVRGDGTLVCDAGWEWKYRHHRLGGGGWGGDGAGGGRQRDGAAVRQRGARQPGA